ncbi:hypothetical protein A3C28_06350 [Candidatus Roizmanbacteria bacterium RIFCSPHIGHO2_02_FULL_39_9]|uniref:Peptidase M20 dimerisation domain-containing protein n=3 Tax=Candidatus Roizmaniibacteriota TaxID=1752723 RepID=A0A1F7H789_9BACT|nr:MAG: hypothetical protein A3C28_06350 [Candidatus Roizmanbacteria bacterium RIFCSPHIGHO2_02_FULL_39_9]
MNKNKTLQLLSNFVSIQSVSADPKRRKQITMAVDLLTRELRKMKFEVRLIKKNNAPPLLYAARHSSKAGKTIGIYAHYDVQPEDPVDEWKTPPFELTAQNGKLYGRGVADDKGHVIQNIYAIKELIVANKLKNNVVFILEGEEEVGSLHFEEMIQSVKKTLSKVDVFYVTDVGMHKKNVPQIMYALRGLVYFEIKLCVGERDLHSGIYGNAVLNPILVLSKLISQMKDTKSGRILIDHFYDGVKKIGEKERELLKKTYTGNKELQKEAQTFTIIETNHEKGYLLPKIHPSFDIHGITSGYTGVGAKTVIPKEIKAKFSFRLVENQNPDTIEHLVKKYIKKAIPRGVKYTLKTVAKFVPFYTDTDNSHVKKTAAQLKEIFGNETIYNRTGGSIGAAEVLQRHFGKPVILFGFTLPDEKAHSPNENIDEEMFWKGIEALKSIYSKI